MAVETPTINRILRVTEFDLLRTNYVQGNMYICLDSQVLYYDESDNSRVVWNYIGIKTVNDLLYNTTPEFGRVYYCWEDNTLWTWENKWKCMFSDGTYPSAYVYENWNGSSGTLNSVYRYDQPLLPADDNGLLHDGSVVIRDSQRIIKGKLYVDDGKDNLVISSYLGGGIRFLPNGMIDTNGEFFISDESKSFLRSELTIKNNELYVDYSERPLDDPALKELKKESHRYQVYHEGNLNAGLIKELTGEMVYNALITDKSKLPNPFDFNVSTFGGKLPNEYALVGHKHTVSDITNFASSAQKEANTVFRTLMNNNITTEGLTLSALVNDMYKFSANSFKLTLTGGASGSGTVQHLTDTTINLTVDPTAHTHTDLVNKDKDLQTQINNLVLMDPDDYYAKNQVDLMVDSVTPTTTPQPGKALAVDENGMLLVPTLSSYNFIEQKHIELTGDITGSVDTRFEANTINITTSAQNILSSVPTSGKALAIDTDGNLPTNAYSSSKLNHTITVNVKNEALGTAVLDTSRNEFNIDLTLNPGSNIIQSKDLDVLIPTLDNNGKVNINEIPDSLLETVLKPRGVFNPNNGIPSTSPQEGYFWTATTNGVIGDDLIEQGDLYVYLNNSWQVVSGNERVISVNGQKGRINLSYNDVNAISSEYINYTIGDTIPQDKIVVTNSAGHIAGATVDKITNPFSILTTNGDVKINTTNSTRTSTDGSQNLDVQLDITNIGYKNILDTVGYVLQQNGTDLAHKQKLNFSSGLDIISGGTSYTLQVNQFLNQFNWLYLDDNNTGIIDTSTEQGQETIDTLNTLYTNRTTKPTILVRAVNSDYDTLTNNFEIYMLNNNIVDATSGDITIIGMNSRYLTGAPLNNGYRTYYVATASLRLTFASSKITTVTFAGITNTNIQFLPIADVTASTAAYIPKFNAQPASKKYVDDTVNSQTYKTTIGNNTDSSFIVTHNLNTEDIVIQFRDNTTKKQVYIDNTVVDSNKVQIDVGKTILTNNQITVTIVKL